MLRQALGRQAVHIVAFTTYAGTVTAADEWGKRPRQDTLSNGLPWSHEALLHEVAEKLTGNTYTLAFTDESVRQALGDIRMMRAVGVVYRPDTERQSHYFEVRDV